VKGPRFKVEDSYVRLQDPGFRYQASGSGFRLDDFKYKIMIPY